MTRNSLSIVVALALALSAVLCGADAQATEVGNSKNVGLGFAVGSPTSIVGKVFVGDSNAIDFGVGFWRFGGRCWGGRPGPGPPPDRYCDDDRYRWGAGQLSLNADYLWQDEITTFSSANLDWHIGAGARLWLHDDRWGDDDFALAARMPVGLDLTFSKPDFLEVFLELAPALYIVPGLGFDIEALLGVRFYF